MNIIPYSSRVIEQITGENSWGQNRIGIFQGETQIGEFLYNYPVFDCIFYPFKLKEKWYAIFAPDYLSTGLMSLPDCKILSREESGGGGFCPVEYYIPRYTEFNYPIEKSGEIYLRTYEKDWNDENQKKEYFYEPFGFVAGCHWGDDTSWKVQYLDLSKADEGTFKREERFGYLELARNLKLKEAVEIDFEGDNKDDLNYYIYISTLSRHRLQFGNEKL